jgi:two-component system chemotaxis response regulator CheY
MAKIVVCVDDSATVLMTAEMALEQLVDNGVIELITFDNPLDAIEKVKDGLVYDLMITDINMPQMSGFELSDALKKISSVRAKPIIALTTENSAEMKVQGKKVGLVGWISKPFSNEKLIMGIKRILRIR